jgi:hypothetical protein
MLTSINTTYVQPNAAKKGFSEGLCGCLTNIPMCLLGIFFPLCLSNHVSWRLDGGILDDIRKQESNI